MNIKEQQKVVLLFSAAFIMVLFATFRLNVGFQDYDEYTSAYTDVLKYGFSRENYTSSGNLFESGFILLYYLASFVSSSEYWALFVVSLIAVTITFVCYKQYTKYFMLAVILYFVHTFVLREMIQIRAGIAAAVCLYSLRYVEREQIWKFLLTILVAINFHLASIVFVLVYWVYKLNWSRKRWSYLVGLSVVIGLVTPLGKVLGMLPGLGPRIDNYMWMAGMQSSSLLTNPTVIKQLFFCSIGLVFWDKLNERVPSFKVFFIPLLMSVCWLCVWNDFQIVAARMGTFFSITEVIVIPSFLYLFTSRSRPIVFALIILYALLTLWLNIQTGNFIIYQGSESYKTL